MNKINYDVGDIVYVIMDYIQYIKFFKGEITNTTNNEYTINMFENGKSTGTIILYKNQSNTILTRDKRKARLIYVSREFRNGFDPTTIDSKVLIDIKQSQKEFPELWI